MPTYKLRGIDVEFPFEAYDCQLVYMEKVIEALQNVGFCFSLIPFASQIYDIFLFFSRLN